MILIITHKEDYTADFVINKLNNLNYPYFRFNCEDLLTYNITIYPKGLRTVINNIHQFKSVWYRRTKLPFIKAENEAERLYLLGEVDIFMQNIFGVIDAKWLSNPISVNAAENKLLQLSNALKVGFNTPKTLISTDKKELLLFAKSNKKTVAKPIGRGRINYTDKSSKLIFTNILPDSIIDNLDEFCIAPAIFQEYIEKDYELRVTVVGNLIFAARVNSQTDETSMVDWRRKKLKFEKYDLPVDISNKCLKLLGLLKISFGAFDLIKATDGLYYFLEVNPNGQWVWIEKETGMPISDAIINFLICQ